MHTHARTLAHACTLAHAHAYMNYANHLNYLYTQKMADLCKTIEGKKWQYQAIINMGGVRSKHLLKSLW